MTGHPKGCYLSAERLDTLFDNLKEPQAARKAESPGVITFTMARAFRVQRCSLYFDFTKAERSKTHSRGFFCLKTPSCRLVDLGLQERTGLIQNVHDIDRHGKHNRVRGRWSKSVDRLKSPKLHGARAFRHGLGR